MRVPGSVLIAALLALSPPHPAGQAKQLSTECRDTCQAEFDDTIATECPACSDAPISARQDCEDGARGEKFDRCLGRCPTFPGRCTLTRGCVSDCRTRRANQLAVCQQGFNQRIRTACPGGKHCLADARKARRQCRRQCRLLGGTAVSRRPRAPSGGCNCQLDPQNQCIRRIVGSCYADCADSCGGDTTALALCQRACRNAQCKQLENACTEGGRSADVYEACCTTCGHCETTIDCVTTTTSTSTSSTTSTHTVSTTTNTSTTTSTTVR